MCIHTNYTKKGHYKDIQTAVIVIEASFSSDILRLRTTAALRQKYQNIVVAVLVLN